MPEFPLHTSVLPTRLHISPVLTVHFDSGSIAMRSAYSLLAASNVSFCLSVCPSVRQALVLSWDKRMRDYTIFTVG